MSILDDDIMSIDQATTEFQVELVNKPFLLGIIRPQTRLLVIELKEELDKIPIMDISPETIEEVCAKFIKPQFVNKFTCVQHQAKPKWAYTYKKTKYSKPSGFLITACDASRG